MIELEALPARVTQIEADLLVLPCFADPAGRAGPEPGPGAAQAATALGVELAATLGAAGFTGELGDSFSTLSLGRLAARSVLFVGLGPRQQAGPGAIRQAAMLAAAELGTAARVATTLPAAGTSATTLPAAGTSATTLPAAGTSAAATSTGVSAAAASPAGVTAAAAAFAEGLLLGAYQFDRYRTDPVLPGWRRPALELVQVLAAPDDLAAVTVGLRRGQLLADLTNWVRDLVNAAPSDATPAELAAQASLMARDHDLACAVLAVPELLAGGFGGILGVGQGSRNEPRLVELSYRGAGPAAPVVALTGKGITFDSGGLNLKRTAEIEYMKSDMAGAATIMAVMLGAAELGLPVNIDAALPFAENMPGGSAQRPGDVLTHRGGKTSEIRDTDSEGRLIVADALAYLAERKPAVLVDVATLTDAAGLGPGLWAVLGTGERQIGELIAAGLEAGDPGWHLPLPAAY